MMSHRPSNNTVSLLIVCGIAILLTQIGLSYILLTPDAQSTDLNLIGRQIDTPLKLWLNGYLGVFFNFKFMGPLTYLLLPCLFVFFLNLKKKDRWEIALIGLYLFAVLLIGIKGYFNFRYRFTLFPASILLLFYFTWKTFQEQRLTPYRNYAVLFLLFLTIINTCIFYSDKMEALANKLGLKVSRPFQQTVKGTTMEQSVDYFAIIDSIKAMNTQDGFLVNNLPMFYYYTNNHGVYFLAELDLIYSKNGPESLLEKYQNEALSQHIIQQLHCRYIFSTYQYNALTPEFDQYLKNHCTELFKTQNNGIDYAVYEIKDRQQLDTVSIAPAS